MNLLAEPSNVVIDANLAILGVLPVAGSQTATERLKAWARGGVSLAAPHLWLSEVTSTIHKLFVLRHITRQEADQALEAALGLPVQLQNEDRALCISAFEWASRLGQLSAYDAIYLALAERLNAPFYTADRRLQRRCQEIGADFVHSAI